MDDIRVYTQRFVRTAEQQVSVLTQFATQFAETLVNKGIWDVKEISDYRVTLGARWVWKASRVALLVLDVGIGEEENN